MSTIDFDILLDNRSDPDVRMVLEDAELSMGRRPVRWGLTLSIDRGDIDVLARAWDATDTVQAAADADAEASGPHIDADAADADGADTAAAGADALTSDGALTADRASNTSSLTALLQEEIDMRNGLKVIQVPGLYGSWSVTRVGWVRRVSGDEYEIVNARTITRTGSPRALDSLASDGPGDDHTLTPPAKAAEELHRLTIRRSMPAAVDVWAEHCPQPEGWQDT